MQTWIIIFGLALGACIIVDGLRKTRQIRQTPRLDEYGISLNKTSHRPEVDPRSQLKCFVEQADRAERIMTALDILAVDASKRITPNVTKAMEGLSALPGEDSIDPPTMKTAYPLHKNRCDAAIQALQEGCMMLRLIDTTLDWEELQQIFRAEHMVHDIQNGAYHASDTTGKPAFSVASPTAPGTLPAPLDIEPDTMIPGLLFMLPTGVEDSQTNFQRMARLIFCIRTEHGGRVIDESGSAASIQTFEHINEQLMHYNRKGRISAKG